MITYWITQLNKTMFLQEVRKIVAAIGQRITYREFLPEVVGQKTMDKFNLNLLESGRFHGYSDRIDTSVV